MDVTTGLQSEPLDVTGALAGTRPGEAGAIASFLGIVRASSSVRGNEGKTVTSLQYEAHAPLAEQRLSAIAEEAAGKWGLTRVVALHRIGSCALGEPSVIVVCSAPHRGEALEACRWLIDEIKASVPIWKQEIYSDGSAWVG